MGRLGVRGRHIEIQILTFNGCQLRGCHYIYDNRGVVPDFTAKRGRAPLTVLDESGIEGKHIPDVVKLACKI
jgi:hypothetical protein